MIVLAHFPLPGLSESRAPEQLTEETGKKKKITIKYLQLAHSSTLGWKIPWMEESGRLLSHGVTKSWTQLSDSLSLFTFMHWRRKWQPTPVFLPGESQGWGSLVG